jgi:hypothetical protein
LKEIRTFRLVIPIDPVKGVLSCYGESIRLDLLRLIFGSINWRVRAPGQFFIQMRSQPGVSAQRLFPKPGRSMWDTS